MMKSMSLCILSAMLTFGVHSQGVLINEGVPGSPDATSVLELESQNKGFLPPRLTSEERDAISGPAEGLLIYNTDTKCYNYFNGTAWQEWCGSCVPQPSVANAGPDQLNINGTSATLASNSPVTGTGTWSIVSGSGGSIASPGIPTSAFSGVQGQSYVLKWSIATSCGTSEDQVTISFATPAPPFVNCGDNLTATHTAGAVAPETKTVTYGTVSFSGLCWITRNLGASTQASSVGDGSEAAAGWYWQFNRPRGFRHDGPNETPNATPSGAMVTYATINESGGWITANDPCAILLGSPWRIPTLTEYNNAKSTGGWANCQAAYSSPLKLHSAGIMYNTPSDSDLLQERGSFSSGANTYVGIKLYSSSSSTTLYAESTGYITQTAGGSYNSMNNNSQIKTNALPLRCVR